MSRRFPLRSWLGLLGIWAAAGCAGPPAEPPAAAETAIPQPVPGDFSVEIAMLSGSEDGRTGAGRRDETGSRLWPGRFVLFCNGSLHWSAAWRDPARGLPPRRRVLDVREMAGLWELCTQLGLADPANATAPINPAVVQAAPGQTVTVAVFTGGGRRWAFVDRVVGDGPADPALAGLIDRLSELAWIGSTPRPTVEVPVRYDFGPDPYARYREP
jgi:hypothetical protein